jgi:hypothetical protein
MRTRWPRRYGSSSSRPARFKAHCSSVSCDGRAHLRLELLEEREGLDEQLVHALAAVRRIGAKLRTGFSEVSITAVISALRLGK